MTSDRKVVWLVGFSHFITHGFMTILPAVLVAITSEQAMSFMDLGIVAGIGYFLYGLGAFPAGYLADRFGSKRLLTIGVLGMAVSSIMVGISSSITFFAVTYALLGVFASIHHPAGLSLIARRIVHQKGKALGLHGVLGNVGLFLSPLIAALSVTLFATWRAAYLLYGIIGLVFFFILYFARVAEEKDLSFKDAAGWLRGLSVQGAERGASGEAAAPARSVPAPAVLPVALLILYVGSILSGFIFRGSLTFLPTLFQQNILFITNHEEPVVMAGYLTTAVLSLGLAGAWLGGYINDKIKHPEMVPVLIFLLVAPALYYASRLDDLKLIAVCGLFSLIYYAWQPSQNYLIAKYTRKSSHGMGFGVSFFLIFGMGSLATSVGGYMADDFGVDRFYWLMAIIALTALFAALAVCLAKPYLLHFSWNLQKEEETALGKAP